VIGRFLTLQFYRFHNIQIVWWQILPLLVEGFAFCILTDSSNICIVQLQISQSTDSQIVQSIDCVFGGFHTLRMTIPQFKDSTDFGKKLWILCLADSHTQRWQIPSNLCITDSVMCGFCPRGFHTLEYGQILNLKIQDFATYGSVLCRFHKLEINNSSIEDSQILQSMDSVLGGFHTLWIDQLIDCNWQILSIYRLCIGRFHTLQMKIPQSPGDRFCNLWICAWQILYFTDWIQMIAHAISMIQLIMFEPNRNIYY